MRNRSGKADQRGAGNDRRNESHVGHMRQAAVIGMIADEHVAVADIAAVQLENLCHQMPIHRRMKEHRWRHEQAAVAVEDDAGKVARLADDGRIAGAVEMVVHFLHQAADAIAHDLGGDGVDHVQSTRSKMRLPWRSTKACQPGGTTVVASNCSTMAGPAKPTPTDSLSRS